MELHQLFLDMSVLVETQGEMLDQIEYSVQQAQAFVEKGVSQLENAKKSQKSSRKVMFHFVMSSLSGSAGLCGGLGGAGRHIYPYVFFMYRNKIQVTLIDAASFSFVLRDLALPLGRLYGLLFQSFARLYCSSCVCCYIVS